MKKTFKFILFMAVLLLVGVVVGYQQFLLADYTYTGDAKTISDVFEGKISVTGDQNRITVEPGSDVAWITILGSDNLISIKEGARVAQIRGMGGNNTIIAPEEMRIDTSGLKGNNNQKRGKIAPSLDGL